MLNNVSLVGRICNDIEVRFTNSGKAVTNITLACDRRFNREETDFIQVVIWGAQAENCQKYVEKGSMIAISGRLHVSDYENQEGKKVRKTEVMADDVRFLSFKKEQQQGKRDPFKTEGKPIDISDDMLPF